MEAWALASLMGRLPHRSMAFCRIPGWPSLARLPLWSSISWSTLPRLFLLHASIRRALMCLPTVAPVLSTVVLIIPLISFIGPALPGAGAYFTNLGFAPTPFPLNILYLFVIGWIVVGLIYSFILSSANPERYDGMGRIIRGDVYTESA